MHRMRVFLFAVLLFAVPAFAQDARIAAFEEFVAATMKAQKMPGLSVAVQHGDFQWSRGFGFSDVENQVPAKPESSYRMGSVSKPFTAVAVLKLVDEGKIDLDAEVQTYVPYFPRKPHKITVRQLLAHQGGISHYRDYMKEGRIKEPKSTKEAIAIFADFDLVNEPGTAYAYTSYGYNLLGAVIEGASGKSYGEYLAENVWKPLGMTATRMDDPRALIPNRVPGYTLDDGELRRSEFVDVSSRFGGGGARSSVLDMVRFVDGLGAGKVLARETLDRAWTAQPTRDQRFTNYGLGFGIVEVGGRWGVEHGGSQQETRTLLLYVPRERFAVALASNFEDANLYPFEEKLISLFLGAPRDIGIVANDETDTAALRAMNTAFRFGLAYYDRHGRAMTTDRRELEKAFRYFRQASADAKLVEDGRHPVASEPLTKVGSYIASVLDANGDLGVYHRDDELRFFADYARVTKAHRLERAMSARVAKWNAEWDRVWTPELQAVDVSTQEGRATLERHKAALIAAPIRPDFSGAILRASENEVRGGNPGGAMTLAQSGLEMDPRSADLNGFVGVMKLMWGDVEGGKALLAKSVELDPQSYARPQNLLNIANYLAGGPMKLAAITLLETATELYPNDTKLRERLEEIRRETLPK